MMIEIKEMYEIDSFHIIGYYSEDHVNKEEFLENVIEYITDDLDEDNLELETPNLPTLGQVEYVWYLEEELDDDSITTCFLFSNRAKEGYSKMTRVYL